MQKKLIYIIPIVSTLLSCSDEIADQSTQYLDGNEKSPLAISVTSPVVDIVSRTRAVDASFEANDVLKAYVRHVTATASGTDPITNSSIIDVNNGSVSGVGPTMAKMTVSTVKDGYTGIANNYDNSVASTLTAVVDGTSTPLYWDDFSNSASIDTDLRTSGHYLQSYYGYCYNGATVNESGTTEPYLTQSTGTITGWKVETDQTNGIKKSDLLWSPTQDPVAYKHATFDGKDAHGIIEIPYTHAMSKVSIEVVCKDGFSGSAKDIFNQTGSPAKAELISMTTVANVVAPESKITQDANSTKANITMRKCSTSGDASDTEKKCSFEAIIIPTIMTDGLHLATISNVDGNKYDINLTTALLETAPTGSNSWKSQLTEDGTTKSGVNYKLVVTIKKQEIAIVAQIADWDDVNATSEGEIKFTTDISNYSYDSGYTNLVNFSNGSQIDLYENTSTTFSSRSSVATYTAEVKYVEGDDIPEGKQVGDVKTPAKWTCDPVLYWQKEGDQEYFRALSPSSTETNGRTITDNKISISAGVGSDYDLLWGTTAKHSGKKIDGTTDYTYEEGAIIDPRTKEVPLIFYHKTSKVKIVLKTGTSSDPDAVDINNAKIQFTNLYTQNTLNIYSGDLGTLSGTCPSIVFAENTTTPENDKRPTTTQSETEAPTANLFMIPQEIPADNASTASVDEASYIIITLANNTVYKLKLRDCKLLKEENNTLVEDKNEDGTPKYVSKWEQGETYTYYIKLTKEKIQFFALIKDWNEVNASGDATMEWDDTIAEDIEAGAPGAGDPNAGQNEGREQGNW